MSLLLLLESIRTPWLTDLCLVLTNLGQEYAFMAVTFWLLWCHDRRAGFRMFPLFLTGMVGVEVTKGALKAPRPWKRYAGLHPVPKALAGAGGYSCPSGHSFSAAASFGGAGLFVKRWSVRLLLWLPVLLTMFTRLYLGVHTLTDVLVGMGLALVFILLFGGLYRLCDKGRLKETVIYIGLAVLSAAAVAVTQLGLFGSGEGAENAPKLLGCAVGILLAHLIDTKKGAPAIPVTLWGKALTFLGGVGVCLGVLTGLKWVFALLCPGFWVLAAVRYFVVLMTAMTLWPWICGKVASKFGKSH